MDPGDHNHSFEMLDLMQFLSACLIEETA